MGGDELSNDDDEPRRGAGHHENSKAHRFGLGNTAGRGRQKGSKNLRTIFNEANFADASYTDSKGKRHKTTRLEIAVHRRSIKAAQGDAAATEYMVAKQLQLSPPPEEEGAEDVLTDEELRVLERYVELEAFVARHRRPQ